MCLSVQAHLANKEKVPEPDLFLRFFLPDPTIVDLSPFSTLLQTHPNFPSPGKTIIRPVRGGKSAPCPHHSSVSLPRLPSYLSMGTYVILDMHNYSSQITKFRPRDIQNIPHMALVNKLWMFWNLHCTSIAIKQQCLHYFLGNSQFIGSLLWILQGEAQKWHNNFPEIDFTHRYRSLLLLELGMGTNWFMVVCGLLAFMNRELSWFFSPNELVHSVWKFKKQ